MQTNQLTIIIHINHNEIKSRFSVVVDNAKQNIETRPGRVSKPKEPVISFQIFYPVSTQLIAIEVSKDKLVGERAEAPDDDYATVDP